MQQEVRRQLFILAALVVAVLASCFLLWWARSGVTERRVETVALLEKIASIEANRAPLEAEYQDFQMIKASVTALDKNFYTAQTIPLFLSELETVAQEAGVAFEITSAEVQGAAEAAGKQVLVEFNASGSYAQLLAFSHELEAKPYHIVFDRYYLLAEAPEKPQKGGPLWQLYGTLRLTTFK